MFHSSRDKLFIKPVKVQSPGIEAALPSFREPQSENASVRLRQVGTVSFPGCLKFKAVAGAVPYGKGNNSMS